MARRAINMAGMRLGRLLVIERSDRPDPKGLVVWRCLCDCGTETHVVGASLRRKKQPTRSCGCFAADSVGARSTTHGSTLGKTRTPTYSSWMSMWGRTRGYVKAYRRYYSDRGITVCDRWRSYENFLADMGPRPGPEYSLDRINNNGNYEPGNCRWATAYVQTHNRRTRAQVIADSLAIAAKKENANAPRR